MSKIIAVNALGALLSLMTGAFSPAAAFGALAVGSTSNVVKDGVAFGTAVNYATETEARNFAIDYCKKFKGAPKAAAQCRLVGSFNAECYAISMDPKAGTPGAGWAIAATKTIAEQRAMENCKATAGKDRREFCEVAEAKCDDVKK
jgi:Domain of unknown function (DUF4189)